MMRSPMRVAITGAAGQLAYSLIFRVASGEVFGADQPLELRLLEITPAMGALNGVAMELDDCAYPLVRKIDLSDKAAESFDGINWGLLVGSKPRGKGMERGDLLKDNGRIFVEQGKALERAAKDIRILVVGNPANTNCLIAMNNARAVPRNRFAAMTRLDHNRAVAQLARKAGKEMSAVTRMTIWGNHSATQFPDFFNARIDGKPVTNVISDHAWLEGAFIATVQKRGAAIIEARGLSSAASAANAAIDHVKSMRGTTPKDDWFSAGVCSDGSYGVPEGLISSFPLRANGKDWEIVKGLEINEFSRKRIDASVAELQEERQITKDMQG
ncbi:MAG: malate dehydrogenase [Candidatus Lambdaproteobacteria bacterium]|nr:malate dehydrogenase [Candidatus Lambdaproteobacteria bacterium]